MTQEPLINVGIMTACEVKLHFYGTFSTPEGCTYTGTHSFQFSDGAIDHNGQSYEQLFLSPIDPDATFQINDVTIGVNFHWQRREHQTFQGAIHLVVTNDGITAINVIEAEKYLRSVISSEMRSTSFSELLKAHAIISRSWLLAQINKHRAHHDEVTCTITEHDGMTDVVRWYDHSDHDLFDVCADDHCQRYQGVNRVDTPEVDRAIRQTAGMVLMYGDEMCDARFSKCCGGVMEQFENCWQPDEHPYLKAKRDYITSVIPDLRIESEARKWILSRPSSFCNTTDSTVLSQVLNSYDMETPDFYRWTVMYSQTELAAIVKERSGLDFGQIIALQPLERGHSGRITKLKIIGSRLTATVGKELEIRKWLSKSHLYSSAFIVETSDNDNHGIPQLFTLHGAGWGHGVGLCQIGAAMMARSQYSYVQILQHYYPGAKLIKLY